MRPSPKPGILQIAPYTPGRAKAAGFASPLKLSANENCLGCSEAAHAAYLEAACELHLYPDPDTSLLRAAIAAKYALEPERLVFGAGSDEIFAMATQAYLGEGDNMVQPQYGFAAWAIAARAAGGSVKSAPERRHTANIAALLAAVDDRTRMLFLANPANPTGTWLRFEEIERLHAGLPKHIILVLDGAYAEFANGLDGFSDGLDWSRDKENVLVTRTFSKIYGLASLRIGWAYGATPMIEALNRIRLPFSLPRAGEAAGVAALSDDAFLERSIGIIEAGRERLSAALRGHRIPVLESATNFVTACFAGASISARGLDAALARRGILVRPLASYGLPNWIRISIGTAADMDRLIDALDAVLEEADRDH